MRLTACHHWPEAPRLIYMAGEEVPEAQQAFEATFPLEGVAAGDPAVRLAEKYHPDKYRQAIQAYVAALAVAPGDETLRSRLATDSVQRYDTFYRERLSRLGAEVADETARTETRLTAIREWAAQERASLRAQIEAGRTVAGAREATKIIPSEEAAAAEKFQQYVDTLNQRYIDLSRQERLLKDRFGDEEGSGRFERYTDLATRFQEGMTIKVQSKIALIFHEGADAKDLTGLQKEMEDTYAAYAKKDGNDLDLSLEDFSSIEKYATVGVDLEVLLSQKQDRSEVVRQLEAQHLLDPDAWVATSESCAVKLFESAERNGKDQAIIDFAKGLPGVATDVDLEDAKTAIQEAVTRAARAGVKETMALLDGENGLNKKLNGNLVKLFSQVDKRIHDEALRQRIDLLSGRVWPDNEPDQRLLRFIRGSLDTRRGMLEDAAQRGSLLEAIKVATVDYAAALKTRLPTGSEALTGRAALDPARLQALVLLGQEAEQLIKNFGHEAEYKQVKQRMDKDGAYPVNLKFHRAGEKGARLRYISQAELGGFNGVDLGATLLTVMAGVTLAANVAKSREKSLENPYVWASAGVLGARYYNDRVPGGVLSYPFAPESEKVFKMTHLALNNLVHRSDDYTRDQVVRFTHDKAEFSVIRELRAKKEAVKKLIETIDNRDSNKDPKAIPKTITAQDLESAGVSSAVALTVNPDTSTARVRYEFYRSLLSGNDDLSLKKLEEDCMVFN